MLIALLAAAITTAPPATDVTRYDALARAFFTAFNTTVSTGTASPALEGVVVEDYVQHEAGIPSGRAGLIAYLGKLHAAVPKLRCDVVKTASVGDLVSVLTRCSTGADPDELSLDVFRVHEGRMAEHWSA